MTASIASLARVDPLRLRPLGWGLPLLLAALVPGCAPALDAPGPASLHADGVRLRDEAGREVLLHGINARIEGLFDVSFDDGRVALEEIPAFARSDLELLRDELGMNALRVPINWSGLQPVAGFTDLDPDYLARLDAVLALCAELEVWCLVDLHQDAWSKHIGEDGAPLWAIVPEPTELLEGPLEDLEARRLSAQVLAAFGTFFAGQAGLQDAYLDMVERLVAHLRGRPFVAGLELFNEPVGDDVEVLSFANRAVQRVHEVDPDRLALFEPNALRNLMDRADTQGGLQQPNAAYAPHLYPEVFSGGKDMWASGDPARLIESTAQARLEADEHGAPLVVTEYGIDPEAPRGLPWIERMLEEMDRHQASRFFWVYEERSQGGWGLYDDEGALREELLDVLARPYPVAVPGSLDAFSVAEGELRVQVTGGGELVLSAPARTLGLAPSATCDGRPIDAERRAGRVLVGCGEPGDGVPHEVTLRP